MHTGANRGSSPQDEPRTLFSTSREKADERNTSRLPSGGIQLCSMTRLRHDENVRAMIHPAGLPAETLLDLFQLGKNVAASG